MATGKTPAQMIMVGILQIRQQFMDAFKNKEYYTASRFLQDFYATLPLEAQKKYTLPDPPSIADDGFNIPPDDSQSCRKYCDEHRKKVLSLVPEYVYGYFEKGKKMKRGY